MSRTSDILTNILTPLLNGKDNPIECDSTEDLLHSVIEANITLKDNPAKEGDLHVMSMDSEALYPSFDIDDIT